MFRASRLGGSPDAGISETATLLFGHCGSTRIGASDGFALRIRPFPPGLTFRVRHPQSPAFPHFFPPRCLMPLRYSGSVAIFAIALVMCSISTTAFAQSETIAANNELPFASAAEVPLEQQLQMLK